MTRGGMGVVFAAVGAAALSWLALARPGTGATAASSVTLVRLPDGGIQPRVVADARGVAHVLYFKGEAAHGDLFHAVLEPGGTFGAPVRVNSQPGAAVATGTIRGGQIALGRSGRVHVAWHGSSLVPRVGDAAPVLYTRTEDAGAAFEPERNVVSEAEGLDGSAVAADAAGHVYVAWHAGRPGATGESNRRLWVARSADEGRTFAPEVAASEEGLGACGCCGVGALAPSPGELFVLFRSAADATSRDSYLLASRDAGRSFTARKLHSWNIAACPMSSYSLHRATSGVLAAWETGGQVFWTRISGAGQASTTPDFQPPVRAPGQGRNRKHPSLAANAQGEILLVWTEGTGWNKGGDLAWQIFDARGMPIGEPGRAPGVPAWSFGAALTQSNGTFTLVF